MKFSFSKLALPGLVIAVTLGAFAGSQTLQAQDQSLYDRLGGKGAILLVVDEFVNNVAADDRINQAFAGADLANLREKLYEQVCEATGGPCTYTGMDMMSAHKGMNVSDADFNATAENLIAALDRFGVPEQEKNELVGAIAGMKGSIVGQ